MADYHLPPTATPAEVSAAIRANGFVIVDNLVSNELMDRVAEELEERRRRASLERLSESVDLEPTPESPAPRPSWPAKAGEWSAVAADGDRRRLLGDLVELRVLDVDAGQVLPGGEKHSRAQQHRRGADPER